MAAWIVLSVILDVGPIAYLFLGLVLAACLECGVRRRRVQQLWARHRDGGSRRLKDRVLLSVLTLVVSLSFLTLFFNEDLWVDALWIATVGVSVMAICYLISRRFLVACTIAALAVALGSAVMAPSLADQRSGDRVLLSRMAATHGYHGLSVVVVDLKATPQVRFANIGSTTTTPFEIGSLTKALTGLVIADEVDRGELTLDQPVTAYLPALRGTAAGTATMRQVVTHTAGLPRDGASSRRQFLLKMPLGINPAAADLPQVMKDLRTAHITDRGMVAYSNLGGAAAGQAAAAAAGSSYPNLMQSRLFGPLRMTDTAVQTTRMVTGGRSSSGRPEQPWVMAALAPQGGVVSTAKDMSVLVRAILQGTAPGLDALTGTTANGPTDSIGIFWGVTVGENGHVIDQHTGSTGGYSSYMGIDLKSQRAVVVLSDVNKDVQDLGRRLLVTGQER